MRKLFLILFIATTGLPLFSQKRGALYYSLAYFKEVDQVFPGKRRQPKNEYIFNRGFGTGFKYERKITRKAEAGLETGCWYFFNNQLKTDELNREFRKRNVLIPFVGKLAFRVLDGKNMAIRLGLRGGPAYRQYINKFNDNSVRVYPGWTWIYGLEFSLYIRLFKLLPKNFKYRLFGCSYITIEKKPILAYDMDVQVLKF